MPLTQCLLQYHDQNDTGSDVVSQLSKPESAHHTFIFTCIRRTYHVSRTALMNAPFAILNSAGTAAQRSSGIVFSMTIASVLKLPFHSLAARSYYCTVHVTVRVTERGWRRNLSWCVICALHH